MKNLHTPSSASLRSASGPVRASEERNEHTNQEMSGAAPTSANPCEEQQRGWGAEDKSEEPVFNLSL